MEEVGRGLLDVVAGLGRLCGNSCRGDDAEDLAALNEALPRATQAVAREVSRRLTAGAAETREVEEESLCICCLDRPRDIVFLSCNHMIVCEQCAPHAYRSRRSDASSARRP